VLYTHSNLYVHIDQYFLFIFPFHVSIQNLASGSKIIHDTDLPEMSLWHTRKLDKLFWELGRALLYVPWSGHSYQPVIVLSKSIMCEHLKYSLTKIVCPSSLLSALNNLKLSRKNQLLIAFICPYLFLANFPTLWKFSSRSKWTTYTVCLLYCDHSSFGLPGYIRCSDVLKPNYVAWFFCSWMILCMNVILTTTYKANWIGLS